MGSVAKVTVNRSSGSGAFNDVDRPKRRADRDGASDADRRHLGGREDHDRLSAVSERATSDARSWAGFMAKSITDLEQIAAGELPSAASMSFFQWAQKSDQVFRYEIFNREGYSQLVADHNKIALLTLSEFSAAAARAGKTGQPVVEAKEGNLARSAVLLRPGLCSRLGRSGARSRSSRPMWIRRRSATGSTTRSCSPPCRSAC